MQRGRRVKLNNSTELKRNCLTNKDGYVLCPVDFERDAEVLKNFDCGNSDLNEFFQKDVIENSRHLISRPYFLKRAKWELSFPLALVDLCNDSVRKEGSKRQPGYSNLMEEGFDIPSAKQYSFLPAVKITRLGVAQQIQGHNIGTILLNMVKTLFVTENRTGCMFLTVDAYNEERVCNFYYQNQFQPFYDRDKDKKTRALFFDLRRLALP